MKILFYGSGVIGSLYSILLSKVGYDVYVYDKGMRLKFLKENGMLYIENDKKKMANVKVIDALKNDNYDFIFTCVKSNEIEDVLFELKDNKSKNIVIMVNTMIRYEELEKICGVGRIIPAFPGAGGFIEEGVLNAKLTPKIIQPTTFGEINGEKSERIEKLVEVFRKSKIPFFIVKDMYSWQICHLAMVIPLANAYYISNKPEEAGYDLDIMIKVADNLKYNFKRLKELNIKIIPFKLNVFRILPTRLISIFLKILYKSEFSKIFMYPHSIKSKDEMLELNTEFYDFIESK